MLKAHKEGNAKDMLNIDGYTLRRMIIEGANELGRHKDEVDALNVFPVPDGDTGTNMFFTVLAAAREVERLDTASVSEVSKAASSGSLRGARGNSGVILSQLFRGFAKGLENRNGADADTLAMALQKASETAYKAIMKPKEGTILTIARFMGETAVDACLDSSDIETVMREIISASEEMLQKTKQMLPELRQANVVDAGGKGLLYFFKGSLKGMHMKNVVLETAPKAASVEVVVETAISATKQTEIEFGYCTEFFIIEPQKSGRTLEEVEDGLKEYLPTVGDSIVVVGDEDIIKVHVHSNNPGLVLEKAMTYGALSSIKIENMRIQHTSILNGEGAQTASSMPVYTAANLPKAANVPEAASVQGGVVSSGAAEEKEVGFVAVAMGRGLKELFLSLNADVVIEGGQTMNPSAEDIATAVSQVGAKNVFVLPNNKNIIMAANQSAYLCEGKNVRVIETKSIPQGISALVHYQEDMSIDENVDMINECIGGVATGQITTAVRDTVVNDKVISEGDVLCMINGSIEIVGKDLQQSAKELVERMLQSSGEVVSIYYGADTTQEMADEIADYITEHHKDAEVEVYAGEQPLYYYIISVE